MRAACVQVHQPSVAYELVDQIEHDRTDDNDDHNVDGDQKHGRDPSWPTVQHGTKKPIAAVAPGTIEKVTSPLKSPPWQNAIARRGNQPLASVAPILARGCNWSFRAQLVQLWAAP
jgi:hypothetical protein